MSITLLPAACLPDRPPALHCLQMGVESLVSFHLHVRLNGKYYGKFSFEEEPNTDTLQRWGYATEPAPGPFWKSLSGEYSNLRWDLPADQVQYYWKQVCGAIPPPHCKLNLASDCQCVPMMSVACRECAASLYTCVQYTTLGPNNASEGQALVDFSRGLAGAAPNGVPRSSYLFDAVNLPQVVVVASSAACAGCQRARLRLLRWKNACMPSPPAQPGAPPAVQVINQMAAQTLILNQDRCTKNYYIYFDHAEGQWSMFPWDPESGG